MVLADASFSSPHRAPRPRSQSPAHTKSRQHSVIGPSLLSESKSSSEAAQKAHKREVSSRYSPGSAPKISSAKLSLSASADFSSSSCNSPKRAASSERRRSGFISPAASDRNSAASRTPSTERHHPVRTDTKPNAGFSSSSSLNSSSSNTLDTAKRAASTERRRASQAIGSTSPSLDCSSCTVSASSKRASSTERGRPSSHSETKSTGSFRKPSLSPSRPAWQSSNGMFSSLQAESALSLVNGRGGRTERRDQTLRPAVANHVADHRGGDGGERKSTHERKGDTPERKGSVARWPGMDQTENARPFENLHAKSIGKRWPGTSNSRNSRSALSRSMDLSTEKMASPLRSSAALLIKDQQANAAIARAPPNRNLSRSLNEGAPSPILARRSSPDRGSRIEGRIKDKTSILQKTHNVSSQQESLGKMQNSSQQESPAKMHSSSLEQGCLAKMQNASIQQETLVKMHNSALQKASSAKMQSVYMQQESLASRIGAEAQIATSIPHRNEDMSKENAAASALNKAASGVKFTASAGCAKTILTAGFPTSLGSMHELTSHVVKANTQQGICETESSLIKLSKDEDKSQHVNVADYHKTLPSNQLERCCSNPQSLVSPGHSQPKSPSGTHNFLSISFQEKCVHLASPSRGGSSPVRTRLPPSPVASNNSPRQGSVNNGMEITNGRRITVNQIEEVRTLRLLQNRLLQWRFVNARAEMALGAQKAAAEKALVNVGLKTFDLQMKVAMLRIKSLKARQIQKLDSLLIAQEKKLQEWEAMHQQHLTALEAVTKALESATLRVPVTGGARADIRATREAVAYVLDVMHSTEQPVRSLQPKVERMTVLLGEVAQISAVETGLIAELEEVLSTFACFQMEEHSLKAHIMQVEHEMDQVTEVIASPSTLSQ